MLNEQRDRTVIDLLPKYLRSEISFRKEHAPRFFTKVNAVLTRSAEVEKGEEEGEEEGAEEEGETTVEDTQVEVEEEGEADLGDVTGVTAWTEMEVTVYTSDEEEDE